MAQKQLASLNDFSKGVNTDASPLNYPAGFAREMENFFPASDGSMAKRLPLKGKDFQSRTQADPSDIYDIVTVTTTLEEAGVPQPLVLTLGSDAGELKLWVETWRIPPGSTLTYNLTISTSASIISRAVAGEIKINVASLGGLVVFSVYDKIGYIETGTKQPGVNLDGVQTRDLLGAPFTNGISSVDQDYTLGTDVFVEPVYLYSLYNGGWPAEYVEQYLVFSGGDLPALNKIWFAGKDLEGDAFDPVLLNNIRFGNNQSPQGHNIITPFVRGLDRVTTEGRSWETFLEWVDKIPSYIKPAFFDSPLTGDFTAVSASALSSWQGRFFYSFKTNGFTTALNSRLITSMDSYIFFSQIADATDRVLKCYGDNDPTAEFNKDSLQSDGGYIVLPNTGTIRQLISTRDALFVLAEKGIWAVTAYDNGQFTSTNYKADKITNKVPYGGKTAVVVGDVVYVPTLHDILAILPDQQSIRYSEKSILNGRAMMLHNRIDWEDLVSEPHGVYDEYAGTVKWCQSYTGNTFEICLNTDTGALYTNQYNIQCDKVFGYSLSNKEGKDSLGVVGAERSKTSTAFNVVIDSAADGDAVIKLYYQGADIGVFDDVDFFGMSVTPTTTEDPYVCTWESGELSQMTGRFQVDNITTHMQRTETGFEDVDGDWVLQNTSSLLVGGWWDFSDDVDFGKSIPEQEVYKLKREWFPDSLDDVYGQYIISSDIRPRGRGRGLTLSLVNNEDDKDCIVHGFSMSIRQGG